MADYSLTGGKADIQDLLLGLTNLLVPSALVNDENARRTLCHDLGVTPTDLSFLSASTDRSFADQFVRYLYDKGCFDELIKLCEKMSHPSGGIYKEKLREYQTQLEHLRGEEQKTIENVDRRIGPEPKLKEEQKTIENVDRRIGPEPKPKEEQKTIENVDRRIGSEAKQKIGEDIPTELSSEEILNDLLNYEGRIKNAVAGYFYCLERRASLKIVIERLGKIIEDPKLVEQPDFWKSIEPEIEENLKVKQWIEEWPESPPAMRDFNSKLGDAINTYTTIRHAWLYHSLRPHLSETIESLLMVAEDMEGLQKKAIELKDHYFSRSTRLLEETEAIISRIGEFLKKAESQSNKEVLNKLVFSQSQLPPVQTRFKNN
ncbi:MAG: hypothetical protein R3C14_51410 [Caldilineaceae bacterium]